MSSPSLRVARIPYLNTDPFFVDWRSSAFSVVAGASPRELGQWAQEGRLDAGPLPVVDAWRLESEFEPVRTFGIAVAGAARSVLLFSKKALEHLERARIGVTDQTSTSVALLRLLLQQRYGLEAVFGPLDDSDDGQLMIGDQALRDGIAGRAGFPHVTDLGLAWHQWQRKPFVFARWVVRRGTPAYLKEDLADQLDRSLTAFKNGKEAVAAAGAQRTGLDREIVLNYLEGFTYKLGKAEAAGEETFSELLKARRCLC
jgi:chorismate dehydratase